MAAKAQIIDFLLNGYRHPTDDDFLAGGKVYTYDAGTLNAADTWTDRNKGATATNPIVLDSAGRAEVYGDNIYKFRIYDAADVFVEEIDGAEYRKTAGDIITTVTNLKAFSVAGNSGNETIQLLGYATAGDGGGGFFRWDTSDLSTEVTADTQSGVYVPPNSDTTGASGAWVRLDVDDLDARWFGSDATALTAAGSLAATLGRSVKIVGAWTIASAVTYAVPLIGDGPNSSIISTSINDGTPVIKIDNVERWHIEGIKIQADSGTKNAIGIQAVNTSNRWFLSNTYMANLATGYDINGWIGEAQNVWAHGCTSYGFKGNQINGARLQINAESCDTGAIITSSSGTLIEGTIEGNTTKDLIVDQSCSGITISAYFENTPTQLSVGETAGAANTCYDITINGGKFVTSANGLLFDNVNGVRFTGSPQITVPIRTTTSAENISIPIKPYLSGTSSPQNTIFYPHHRDNSTSIKPILNLFPNPTFKGGIKGCGNAFSIRGTGAVETTTVREESAWKLTCTTSETNTYTEIPFNSEVVDLVKGKTLICAAWVYIPDITSYQGDSPASLPDVTIVYNDGSETQTTTQQKAWKEGNWNLFVRKLPISATATTVAVRFHANRGGSVDTENAYCIFTDVFLGIAPIDIYKVTNGQWTIHPLAGWFEGPNWVSYGSAAPTDTDHTYAVGDRVYNTAPAAGGTLGWVCTTAGSPGTWKTFGTIAS